jgi:predicted amidophosphoribosyltransferase
MPHRYSNFSDNGGFPTAQEPRFCPHCGEPVSQSAGFCSLCGKRQ